MFCCLTALFGFLSRFRTFGVLGALAVGRVMFLVFLRVSYQNLSANQWHFARLAFAHFVLINSYTSDAAPSSFVPRFQRSGDSSLFFASFRIPACSELLSGSLCVRV